VKVALVGHGKMGHEVEAVLRERGHDLAVVGRDTVLPRDCVVGIDFTRSEAVPGNVEAAMKAGLRYVVGTTGWADRLEDIQRIVTQGGGGLVHAANFSVGVNLFYKIVRDAAATLAKFPDYDPYILERHHRQKKDAPSGTAKVLAGIVSSAGGKRPKPTSTLEGALPEDSFHIAAVRAGGIVGEHTVGFDSGGDEILLEHRARNRRGFALGAVLAAEWISTRTGVHSFDTVLEDLSRG
jgi:4-hydroxy-tetrahydrodipicolinate reductase